MASKRSQLGIIFLTIFIDLVGFGIVIPVLPRYAEHYGASPVQNGWLVGVYSLAAFFFTPILGKISDRVGRKPVLVASIFGTAVGFYLMGAAQSLLMLFVARIIDGISGGNIGTAQAYIADVTAPEERSKAMGLIGAAFGLGFVFGPAIGGIMSAHYGFSAPMYLAAAMAAANAVLVFFVLPESLSAERRGTNERKGVRQVFEHANVRVFGTILCTYFCQIAGFSMMTALFTLFTAHRFGMDEKHTGYTLALVGIIGTLIQGGLLRQLLKRASEARLAAIGALILALGLFALPMSPNVGMMVLFSGVVAVGNSLVMPTLTGLASRNVSAQWQGRAMGVMQSVGSLARWSGPTLAGWLLTFDSQRNYCRSPFWTGGVLLIAAFALTLSLHKQGIPLAELEAEEAGARL